ncbi:hypothetical protein RB595_000200 [Gaeumannomyces hyphopodioides]
MSPTPLVPDQLSWTLFARLPAELQLEILERCHQNDLVCLSLASRFFRFITLPLLPAKPSLLEYKWDRMICDTSGLLSMRSRAELSERLAALGPAARQLRGTPLPDNREVHSDTVRNSVNEEAWCVQCLSTGYPLYAQLQDWMGSRKFCTTCRKFTKRPWAKRFGRRCQHGQPWKRLRGTYGWSKPSRDKPEKYEPRISRRRARVV